MQRAEPGSGNGGRGQEGSRGGKRGLAGRAANEALAIGRMDTAQANKDVVEKVIYTAAMDKNTCGACAEVDGQEFTLEDAPALPNPECAGGDLCRCQLVPVVEGVGR